MIKSIVNLKYYFKIISNYNLIGLIVLPVFLLSCDEHTHLIDDDSKKAKYENVTRGNINGIVKTIKTTYYRSIIDSGKYTKGEKKSSDPVYLFDKRGNLIEILRYSEEGVLEHKAIRHYNKKGVVIKVESINCLQGSKGGHIIREYEYDKHNTKRKVSNYGNVQLPLPKMEVFDEYGNIIEETFKYYNYTAEVSIISVRKYKYKYDSQGNWIEKIDFIDNVPQNIEKRIIEYY